MKRINEIGSLWAGEIVFFMVAWFKDAIEYGYLDWDVFGQLLPYLAVSMVITVVLVHAFYGIKEDLQTVTSFLKGKVNSFLRKEVA